MISEPVETSNLDKALRALTRSGWHQVSTTTGSEVGTEDPVHEAAVVRRDGEDAMGTERDRMLAGELYDPMDPELVRARDRARDLC